MKSLTFSFVFMLFWVFQLSAQITEPDTSLVYIYSELVGTQKPFSTKVIVEIDFGQERNFFLPRNSIVDPQTGKPISFNSMVDAMNFMGNDGWEFVQAYIVTTNNQNVFRWLLKRACRKNAKGEYIPLTRAEYLKAKK